MITLSEQELNEIAQYPKIELHCHLDGSLPKDLIKELAQQANIEIPSDEAQFENMITITEECKSLIDCFKLFDFPIKLLQTAEAIKASVFGLMKEIVKENIKYIEIRFAPQLHTEKELNLDQVLQAAVDGLNKGKEELKIEGGIIICVLGDYPSERGIELIKTAEQFLGKGVIGVDLARVFTEHMNHIEVFKLAKQLGFKITIHAGEFPPAQTVIDCIAKLNADRIGHGVYAALDDSIMHQLREQNIPLEVCLTSNIHSGKFTQGFQNYEQHFVGKLIKNALNISINSDNRTISNTTLNKEFTLLKQHFQFEKKQFRQIYENSVEAAFATEEVKKTLRSFSQQFD